MVAKLVYSKEDLDPMSEEIRDCPLKIEKGPDFAKVALKMATILHKKNEQYGSSFSETHKIMQILYPGGVSPADYPDMLAIVRILDKLFRISRGDQGDESAWKDICGYALLKVAEHDIE